jgi:hypothetical protein
MQIDVFIVGNKYQNASRIILKGKKKDKCNKIQNYL